MRIAIPYWQGRVSPVLDAAGRCLLVDVEHDAETARRDAALVGGGPLARSREFSRLGVDVLICGALSRPLAMALQAAGVQVRPHICGQVEQVLAALVGGQLDGDAFLMPGCCGRRRRSRAGRGRGGRYRQPYQEGGDFDAQR